MAQASRRLTLGSLCILGALAPLFASAQAVPRTYFGVCGSQGNLPTIYFSGVVQGTAAAFAGIRAGFQQYLAQQFGYKGVVACVPANNAVGAQNFIDSHSTALRNAKRTVVDTGWQPALLATQPPPAGATQTPASSAAGQSSQMTSVINDVFGTSSGGAGCGAPTASNANGGKPPPASGGTSTPSGCQSPFQQVSAVLTGIFNNKAGSTGGSAGGGGSASGGGGAGGGSQAVAKPSSSGSGALGFGQSATNKLAVYGCGRQDAQVACVTDVTNQNQKDTLMQAADVWKNAFIVDDRGDRHQRTAGFFLNIDGDQRSQIDVSYGKTVRFVLMFDSVPTKVQKVALRSGTDSLDVEDINLLIVPAAGTSQTGAAPR